MPTVTLGSLVQDVGHALSRIKLALDVRATPVVSARHIQDVLPPVETLETVQAVFGRGIKESA